MAKISDVKNAGPVKPRTGFMIGRMHVPDDFDAMAAKEIQDLFEATSLGQKLNNR